ncbi:MAG: hypothetical protein KDC19_10775, partial [Saprospiraceae bacterium]|nr:hypothetical protein [Saprospiraceae bacterium]
HLEKAIAALEAVMAEPGFFDRPESAARSAEHESLRQSLATAEAEWERCVERMTDFPE